MKNKVVSPFYFEKPMVIGDTFLAMMENNALHYVPVGTGFQLDGAQPHFSHHVCAFLDNKYPDRWGEGGPIH